MNKNYYYGMWDEIIDSFKDEMQFGWKKLTNYEDVECAMFDKTWITEIISKNDVKRFVPEEPVFIVSQTGTGKTTFVFDACLPDAIENKKKILYLANRCSLVEQMKQRCMQDQGNKNQYDGHNILIRDMKIYYTDELIRQTNDFGGIDVYSYHKFLTSYKRMDLSRYQYVILDEAAFFVSDASFNPYTEEILDIIVKHLKDAVRIYLSATPQECITTIYQKEMNAINKRSRSWNMYTQSVGRMRVYVVAEDYRYLTPYFFDNDDFILKKIKHSSIEDYWLIFVRNKKHGDELKKHLEGIGGGVKFFTADSDKSEEEYLDLVNNERLPVRVLISTKVLDVGVNIRTSNLHMVVYEDNIVEMKQMIGRKRVKAQERLDVYFFLANFGQLKRRFERVEERMKTEKELIYNKDKFQYLYQNELKHPLYFCDGIKANSLSLSKVTKDYQYYDTLIDALAPYENDIAMYRKTYGEYILDNFPGVVFSENMMTDTKSNAEDEETLKEDVLKVIHSRTGMTLDKEGLHTFSDELKALGLDPRIDQRSSRGHMGKSAINKILIPYGYCIESSTSNPVTYKIIKKTEE